ncbi:MAG TPA: DUF4389 domain-containing protein [Conexibacter sp.]|jgi:hypothetical protein|nr:DUF4389 domain-containing protein [Conexibacter sp.]
MSHPVKLRLSDDLERTRVTVFFRLLLAIPHFVWLYLWGIAVFFMTILNWFATLATGTPWETAHAFASRYVRYTVHVYAYVALLADPYPTFGGNADYPVDVELPEPGPQSRWTVLFRLLLALPALLLGSVLATGFWYSGSSSDSYYQLTGLLTVVALLGWFAILARSRMPRGLRDAGAYAVAYQAQLYAYLLLVTDRYPNSDPLAALGDLPVREDPIRLDVDDDRRRRRATTFFRLLLAFPHFAWLLIWGIAAYCAAIASWFVQVVAGRPHEGFHRFIATYLRYGTHVYAYVYLLAEPYPEFDGRAGGYPIGLTVAEPQRQDRLTVAFRLVLAIPAFIISGAYGGVAFVAVVLGWFSVLVRGEMPLGLRNAIALWLRYNQQTIGYVMLLTERYPYGGPAASGPAAEPHPPVFLPPDPLAA